MSPLPIEVETRYTMTPMTTEAPEAPSSSVRSLAGKYLTFILGRESFGIAVLKIREIIRLIEITSIPRMPPYVKGVVNLRGKIIPVIDLRIRFGLASAETTENTCIIVVQVSLPSGVQTQMGFVVDGVEEVIQIAQQEIEETPDFGSELEVDYLLGMAKIRGAVKTLLDIDRVVASDTISHLHQSTSNLTS
jgi:purine-binding chemotaxis protein CheW